VAGLTEQLASADTNLTLANHQNMLLGNRLRRDVAERLVIERKFNNPLAVAEQLKELKQNPATTVSADSIYAGLDVEVGSNGAFHVLSPD